MRSLLPLLLIPISFFVYAVVLLLPIPPVVGLAMRYQSAIALAILLLVLYPVYRQRNCIAASVSFSLTLAVFALPLSGLWNSGVSEYPVLMGGLFPFTDGSNYYEDAQRLLAGGRFDAVSSGRPLFAGVLAVFLGLTQQNLQLALAIAVAMGAIACFLFAREVQQQYGVWAALTIIATLFLFYRRFIGAAWTEHLGLTMGAIALALLWRTATAVQQFSRHDPLQPQHRKPWNTLQMLFLLGVLLLTLALNARAGAFLVLPLLVMWGSWVFRPNGNPFSLRLGMYGILTVAAGFGLNYGVLTRVGRPDVAFSNISYVVYSQVVGSQDWRQVRFDYPEVLALDYPAVTQRIYELAWAEFLHDPLQVFWSALNAIATYLSPTPDGLFGFVSTYGITPVSHSITIGLYLLCLVGFIHCLRHWQEPPSALVLVYGLGILASLPLVPPWIDGVPSSMRVYAATMPIVALLPALGLTVCVNYVTRYSFTSQRRLNNPLSQVNATRQRHPFSQICLPLFGIALILLSIPAPMLVTVFRQPVVEIAAPCPEGQTPIPIWYHPGAAVHLVADDSLSHSHLPYVRLRDFRTGVATVVGFLARRNSRITNEIRELATVKGDRTIIDALNLTTRYRLWVVAPTRELPSHPGRLHLCGMVRNNVLYATDF